MKLYIVPENIHERVMAIGPTTYASIFNAETIKDVLPFNDIVALCVARDGFEFDFEDFLGINLGASPLDQFINKSERDGLPDPDPFIDELRWGIKLNALEREKETEQYVSKYTAHPLDGDVWVVVKQSVHCNEGHPNEDLTRHNESFFEQLIASVYYDVDLNTLSVSSLFKKYLLALRLNSGTNNS